jgi:hypothetical protein
MKKILLQIMLSDVGWSNFKRLVMFCTEEEREERALRRKLLIESRKLGHLTCHERRAWSCLAFCSIDSSDNKTYWVTLSILRKQFYSGIPDMKIIGHGNTDNNLESSCIWQKIMIVYMCLLCSVCHVVLTPQQFSRVRNRDMRAEKEVTHSSV